jgi:hypothetical protein
MPLARRGPSTYRLSHVSVSDPEELVENAEALDRAEAPVLGRGGRCRRSRRVASSQGRNLAAEAKSGAARGRVGLGTRAAVGVGSVTETRPSPEPDEERQEKETKAAGWWRAGWRRMGRWMLEVDVGLPLRLYCCCCGPENPAGIDRLCGNAGRRVLVVLAEGKVKQSTAQRVLGEQRQSGRCGFPARD